MLKSCFCSLFLGMYADMWNQQLQNESKSNEFIETDQEKISGDKTVATHRNHQ